MKDLITFLMWCSVINYSILIVWFVAFVFAHERIYRLHQRWFHVSLETYDTVHLTAMAVYKLGVLMFNLVPLAALYLTDK